MQAMVEAEEIAGQRGGNEGCGGAERPLRSGPPPEDVDEGVGGERAGQQQHQIDTKDGGIEEIQRRPPEHVGEITVRPV